MSEEIKGRRVYAPEGQPLPIHDLEPGDFGCYTRDGLGTWYARTPNGHIANLARHTVAEHEDGTISVSPSIAGEGGSLKTKWHGHLKNGIWTEAP